MTPETWSEFALKIKEFGEKTDENDENDENDVWKQSFILNNQLAVFASEGRWIFQQIFSNGESFNMKPNYLKLSEDQIYKLYEIVDVVCRCVL